MEKIDKKYDLEKIKVELNNIINDVGWLNKTHIYLQTPDGLPYKEQLLRSNPENNKRYITLTIKDDTEIARYILENSLYRTRVLKLPTGKCYSWHSDKELRVHLAVTTNDKCFIVENKKLVNVPSDGSPYLINTINKHTAMNCNREDFDRIHIVGTIDTY